MSNSNFHEQVKKTTSEFTRTDDVIKNISRFLNENKELNDDDSIIRYLLQHLVIAVFAEIEKKIRTLLKLYRKNKLSDPSFYTSAQQKIMRAVKRNKFNELFEGIENIHIDDKHLNEYISLVSNRHKIAHHGTPSNLTWSELEDTNAMVRKVMKALQKHLDE